MADEPPTSPPTPPPTSPDEKPAFVAGLPEGPLWRPMCYDGPLVCPFYGPDHPARRDEESTEAFNEDVARVAFGDTAAATVHGDWGFDKFTGDAWLALFFKKYATRYLFERIGELEEVTLSDPTTIPDNTSGIEEWRLFRRYFIDAGLHIHLEGIVLRDAFVAHIGLNGAHMERSTISECVLHDVYFELAWLCHSHILMTTLSACSMPITHLEGVDFSESDFPMTVLALAWLNGADIRGAQDFIFDSNEIAGLRIAGNSSDPWSVLRTTYTGPRFFVHLVLTLAFLLPFALKAFHLTAMGEAYEAVAAVAVERGNEGFEAAIPRAGLREVLDRYDRHHAPTPAWWVLVGGLEAWYFAFLTAVVVAYNVVRLVIMFGVWRCPTIITQWVNKIIKRRPQDIGSMAVNTAGVTALREAEERSRVTPSLEEYYGPLHPVSDAYKWRVLGWTDGDDFRLHPPEHEPGRATRLWREWLWMASCWLRPDNNFPLMAIGLYRLHCVARVLFWLAVAAFVFRAAHWVLTATVPAPIDALL